MNKQSNLLIIDSTLRDGSHAVHHQFTKNQVVNYCRAAEKAGVELLVIGHGNGLGASSLQLGKSLVSDEDLIKAARKNLKKTKLSAFLIPGFGTIKDNLIPAIKIGIDALMIASHCTEANITRQHIEYSRKHKLKTYGVLMMAHRITGIELLEQAKLMEDYGADGILIMDSAGALLPADVKERVGLLSKELSIPVGFHAHNNFGMAIANSLAALESGAKILDTTTRGLGAGAGNCQLEVLVAILNKLGYKTRVDLYQLMDISEKIIAPLMKRSQEITSIELTSGLAGVFSGFAPHAKKASQVFKVDVRDILVELGQRKAVAGQEDLIIDVAQYLKRANHDR